MPIAMTQEQQALQASLRDWAKRADPVAVVPAAIRLDDVLIPPEKLLAGTDTADVRDLAATLFAAEASGVAAWCSGTAAEYARTRRQFGRPIGSFQAVKQLCATVACRAERAAVLAWDAARAADQAPAEHRLAAAAAAALALDDAVDNAKDCIQVLGGIGFTWEHDAHLYLRRALALRQLLGGSPGWRVRAAELAGRGARRHLRPSLPEAEASLARTDPDVPKHEGLSYFLVNMRAPGLDIRPLREITGRAFFNEVSSTTCSCPTTACWARPATAGGSRQGGRGRPAGRDAARRGAGRVGGLQLRA